jgi:hypothetical protein
MIFDPAMAVVSSSSLVFIDYCFIFCVTSGYILAASSIIKSMVFCKVGFFLILFRFIESIYFSLKTSYKVIIFLEMEVTPAVRVVPEKKK